MKYVAKQTRLYNKNVITAQGRTSMRLDPEFWDALRDMATQMGQSLNHAVSDIAEKFPDVPLTQAVRAEVLRFYRRQT